MCLWLIPVHYANPSQLFLESRGTSDYYGQQCTTQSQKRGRSLFLSSAKVGATRPAGPLLVVKQGHQTEWPHLHPVGSIAAFLHAPSIFSTALQHGLHLQWILLIVFYRLFYGCACTLPDRKFCLDFSDGRFYYLHYLISSKGYF